MAEQAWRPTTDGPVTISESDLRDVVATLSAIQGLFSESRQPVTGFLTATVTSNSSEPPDLKIGSITPVGESPLIENWIRPPGYQSPLLAMTREDFILLTDAQKAGLKARVEQLLRRYNGLLTEGQQNGSATQRSFVLDSDALP